MARFPQIDREIAQCEKHLDASGTRNTEAEAYLVRYLLVRICAEYETRIRTIVQRRCTRTTDRHFQSFGQHWAVEATRRFKVSDLAWMLGCFGDDYKKAFSDAVSGQPSNAAWDNIYINRHAVAHGNGAVMMTLGELKKTYCDSTVLIDELVKVLDLNPRELKGLT